MKTKYKLKFKICLFFLVFSCILLFQSCAKVTQFQPLNQNEDFVVFDNKSKKELKFDEFIDILSQKDIILLGEEHDKLSHHRAQTQIIKELMKKQNLAVVFEMLSTDKQAQIDAAKTRNKEISPHQIKREINWDKKWHYPGYEWILDAVFYSPSLIIAGNLSKDEINTVISGAQSIKGQISTASSVREKLGKIIAKSHKNLNADLIEIFVEIQQFKDRRMADKLVHSQLQSVLIAGRAHTDKSMGVPLHIKDFQSKKSVAVIHFASHENGILNYENSDFTWLMKEK